jgi:hypothetical protein
MAVGFLENEQIPDSGFQSAGCGCSHDTMFIGQGVAHRHEGAFVRRVAFGRFVRRNDTAATRLKRPMNAG